MRISDIIADFINNSLERSSGCCELRRSDLAERFGCVPSQINYVIATRFLPEHGYIVESRRGGGGYIRIRKVLVGNQMLRMHAVNSVGDEIDPASAEAILVNLRVSGALKPEESQLIASALSERSLKDVPPEIKGQVRASILKNMLMLCAGTGS